MTRVLKRGAYPAPADHDEVLADWHARGFSFGVFRDPPGRLWADFVHDTDEYITVAEGRLEVTVGNETAEAVPGDLVRIPAGVTHSVRTLSSDGSVWLYGYGRWESGHG